MYTAQALNFRLLEDIHEAQYKDDQVQVFSDECRKHRIYTEAAKSTIRLYAQRGIALHNNMTDDMFRSCFYENAGNNYIVPDIQIKTIRSMLS